MDVTYFGEEITDEMKDQIEEYLKTAYSKGEFEVYSREYVEEMDDIILANGEFQETKEFDCVEVDIWG